MPALMSSPNAVISFLEIRSASCPAGSASSGSGNPLDLGLIGLAEFLPLPLLALPAGQLADRISRKLITAFGLLISAGIASALVVVTVHGARSVWPFFALAACSGVA